MVYTAKSIRDCLWEWGDNVMNGYYKGHPPADPEKPRLAAHFASRLPCDVDHLSITCAFGSLNANMPKRIDDLGFYYTTRQFTRPQMVLWLYYVGVDKHGAWGALKFRQDWQAMSPEARSLLLDLEAAHPGRHVLVDDLRGDDLIAARLRISRATVYRDRNEAIGRMVAFLQPPQPAESAA